MTKNHQQTPPSGLGIGDIAYVLFKHKWKLILISLLGLAGAGAYYLTATPLYVSEAKLMVRYVVERSAVDQIQNTTSMSTGPGGDAVIQSEVEILNSRDLAKQVGSLPGMEDLVPKSKAPFSPDAAARVIAEGLKVSAAKGSNVIRVEFKHPNWDLAQEVLKQLVLQYFIMHLDIHRSKVAAKFVTEKVEMSRTKLRQAEDDLMRFKTENGFVSLPEAIAAVNEQAAKAQFDLRAAETQLAEQRARVAAFERLAAGKDPTSPVVATSVPAQPADTEPGKGIAKSGAQGATADALPATGDGIADTSGMKPSIGTRSLSPGENEYENAVSGLKLLESERADMLKIYRKEHYAVKELDEKIARQQSLIEVYKERSIEGSTRRFHANELAEREQIASLEARVENLKEFLAATKKNAERLATLMPKLAEMEMARDIEAVNYKYMSASLEKAQVDEALDGSKMPNISTVQGATPAVLDVSKRIKIALGIAGGTAGAAIALALLFGLILDKKINRPQELENRLGVPLLLSIPFFTRNDRLQLYNGANGTKALNWKNPWRLMHRKGANGSGSDASTPSQVKARPDKAPWEVGHFIRPYSESVRDRLSLYFEVRGITHKPKLLGVTSFSQGAGTSTLAAGLAAALSETGDGKVLLVDMNADGDEGDVHPFYAGRPAVPLDDALKPSGNLASAADNLYLATAEPNAPGSGSLGLNKFRRIMRDLKASDFDYMVFDMPTLGQTSSSAAMAGLMDQVLVIVEAEANSPEEVKRGFRDLVDSCAKVSVVLNKARSYAPKGLVGAY